MSSKTRCKQLAEVHQLHFQGLYISIIILGVIWLLSALLFFKIYYVYSNQILMYIGIF